jgi:hypothetical protein
VRRHDIASSNEGLQRLGQQPLWEHRNHRAYVSRIQHWNVDPLRTHAEVIAAFEGAIAALDGGTA